MLSKTKVHIHVKTVTWLGFCKTKKRWPALPESTRLAWVSYIFQETVIGKVTWKEEREIRIIYLAFCKSTLGLAYLKNILLPTASQKQWINFGSKTLSLEKLQMVFLPKRKRFIHNMYAHLYAQQENCKTGWLALPYLDKHVGVAQIWLARWPNSSQVRTSSI